MKKTILTELEHYGEILEEHFRDMVDIEFTVEMINCIFYLHTLVTDQH